MRRSVLAKGFLLDSMDCSHGGLGGVLWSSEGFLLSVRFLPPCLFYFTYELLNHSLDFYFKIIKISNVPWGEIWICVIFHYQKSATSTAHSYSSCVCHQINEICVFVTDFNVTRIVIIQFECWGELRCCFNDTGTHFKVLQGFFLQ